VEIAVCRQAGKLDVGHGTMNGNAGGSRMWQGAAGGSTVAIPLGDIEDCCGIHAQIFLCDTSTVSIAPGEGSGALRRHLLFLTCPSRESAGGLPYFHVTRIGATRCRRAV